MPTPARATTRARGAHRSRAPAERSGPRRERAGASMTTRRTRSTISLAMDLVLAPEVVTARERGRPIVALESTLVAHGLPWPDNLDVARELEATVLANGATPATIAVVDGAVRIGLPSATLELLAKEGRQFAKAGATDLALYVARKTSAATTVSATAVLAARAGIRVFATG